MSNNIYDILKKLNSIDTTAQTETAPVVQDKKVQLQENISSVLEGRKKLEEKWGKSTEVSPEEQGKYKGKSLAELKKAYNRLKDSGPHKKGSEEYGRMRELAFAIRAKTGWGKVSEGSDDLDDWYGFKKGADDKKYTSKVHKGSYGTEYQGDSDDDDDTDTKKKKAAAPAGEKRGRGRPKGAKNRVLRQGEKRQAKTTDTGEKRGRGRPPGSKNKAKAMEAIAEADSIILKGLRSLLEGSIQGGVWTDQPPKPGQKNVPAPVPMDPVMDKDGKIVKPADKRTAPSKPADSYTNKPNDSMDNYKPADKRIAPAKPTDKRSEVDAEQGVAEGRRPDMTAWDRIPEKSDDDWGSMSKREFKRRELELELGNDERRSFDIQQDYNLVNTKTGKLLTKDGVPSVFSSERHARAVAAKLKFGNYAPVPVKTEGMAEDDMEEGNAFGKAVRDAKADGIQPGEKITVGGKTYPVKESKQIDECGDMGPMANSHAEQPSKINVSANMSSDGAKSVTVTADGAAAQDLMQLLTLAGLDGNRSQDLMQPVAADVDFMEEKDSRYEANTTPEEDVLPVQAQIKGGDGDVAGREKIMSKHGAARFSDNPLAAKESVEPALNSKLMREYNALKVTK